MEDFHARFRKAFEDSKKTVKAMSIDSGVSQRTIENWLLLDAPTMPKIDQIAPVARVLGVSLEWLASGEDSISYEDRALLTLARKHADILADVDVLPPDKLEFIKMQVRSVADFIRESGEKKKGQI